MTSLVLRFALSLASLAVAVTAPTQWMAILFAFLSGMFLSAAIYGRIIERAGAEHDPY
jgi:hypothetical protein